MENHHVVYLYLTSSLDAWFKRAYGDEEEILLG